MFDEKIPDQPVNKYKQCADIYLKVDRETLTKSEKSKKVYEIIIQEKVWVDADLIAFVQFLSTHPCIKKCKKSRLQELYENI